MITRIHNNVSGISLSRFDDVIEWLVISLLAFMPLAFGAVEAWSEEVVLTISGAIFICFLLKLVFERGVRLIWSWAYVPIALVILVAVFQLVPLPTQLVSAISPRTVATRQEFLQDLPNSSELLKFMTLSFYSNATKHDLRLVLAVAAVFFVVVNVYRETGQVRRLLAAIAIVGGVVAILALGQDLFGNGKIYWMVPPGRDEARSGPFVNHSHYGQFMNLSIGAAVGLLLMRIRDIFSGKKITPTVVCECMTSPAFRSIWLLVVMVILGAATVFMSLSRGAMVSMLIAAGLTTLVLSSRRSLKGHGWIMVLLALGAFVCILYLGFDAVYDRLSSLQELHQAEGGRWQIVKDIAVAWTKFPAFGTGLGTHEVVYPMFDRSTVSALAAYAENEYAQAAEETGCIGLGALAVFGIIVWMSYARIIRNDSMAVLSATYGLGFGLLAIMIHSFSDFGQHVPANAFLSAVFCALLLVLVHIGRGNTSPSSVVIGRGANRTFSIVALVCVSGIWGWILFDANNARLAEACWKRAMILETDLMKANWQADDQEYVELIASAAKASHYQPENIKYRHWLNVYRWQSISRLADPNTGELVIPPQAVEFVRRIVEELNLARPLCPTFGATYCVTGQLQKFVLNNPKGAENIRKGYKLASCDPVACFVMGLLEIEAQHVDAAFEKFERAVQLDEKFFQSVINVYIHNLNRPDLAVDMAGDNIYKLSLVANALADMEEHKEVFEKAQARTKELLKARCACSDASADAFASLAKICRRGNDIESAIENYRRALTLDYSRVYWRYTLAQLLAAEDKVSEAIREARICLSLRPQFTPAKELIADLSVLPGGTTTTDGLP